MMRAAAAACLMMVAAAQIVLLVATATTVSAWMSSASASAKNGDSSRWRQQPQGPRLLPLWRRRRPSWQSSSRAGSSRQFQSSRSSSSSNRTALPSNTLLSVDQCLELFHKNSSSNNNNNNVVFCDGTWFHKGNRNGRAEFEEGPRIRGAKHLDLSDICMPTTSNRSASSSNTSSSNTTNLFAMLPPPNLFASTMDALGISHADHVVVYGKAGALFLPRPWFLFHYFGHAGTVSLMQASLEEWTEAGGPVETGPTTVPFARNALLQAGNCPPSYRVGKGKRKSVVDKKEVLDLLLEDDDDHHAIILDARGSSFCKGHIPGAKHVPYSSLTVPGNGLKLKSTQELLAIFEAAGLDVHDTSLKLVCSCGSGVSACNLMLALEECGRPATAEGATLLYDGSWQEWKLDPDTPKVLPHEKEQTR